IALLEVAAAAPGAAGEPVGAGGAGPAPSAPPAGAPPPRQAGARLSPLVRRLAEEHGIPLAEVEQLRGSGAGGRVTKEDLLRYVAQRETAPAVVSPATPPAAAPSPAGPPVAPAPAVPTPAAAPGDRLLKLSPLRRTIAQRMAQSKREIPHAYGVIEVDMTGVVDWREKYKDEWRQRHGVALTYTAFFVRAAAEALRAFPVVNSTWTEEGVLLRGRVNVGVGVALEDGLIVPVIKDADQKSLLGIARDLEDLSRRAREGKLTLEDVEGGTFTITNPGIFGSIWSMPIILPGQAAILATDAIVRRPVVVGGRGDGRGEAAPWGEAIAIRSIMHLGLSFDHRVFDGAVADRFLNHIKARLEGFRGGQAAVTDL
ncbi:MAG: dihydrolipoamide acetyltransferase family protein, partial [Armatimonadota bacterium]|nr:dihydrolipoamide acetyltransferase family protein [Armatimonadota bacterium]